MRTETEYVPAILKPELHDFSSLHGKRRVISTLEIGSDSPKTIPIVDVIPLTRMELVEFVKSKGCDPCEWLHQQTARGVRIIGIGNIHVSPQMDRHFTDLLRSTLQRISPEKILIGIELEKKYQSDINAYLLGERTAVNDILS